MVIGIFGESCTGKTTLAKALQPALNARVFSGKDYLRLAKSETEAQKAFTALLHAAVEREHILYLISEPQHLSLLPREAFRILVTADLQTIQSRFAGRMGGKLPPAVAAMLEQKHGCFDHEPHQIHYRSGQDDLDAVCREIEVRVK